MLSPLLSFGDSTLTASSVVLLGRPLFSHASTFASARDAVWNDRCRHFSQLCQPLEVGRRRFEMLGRGDDATIILQHRGRHLSMVGLRGG
jgi:hypothetical protein